MSAFDPQTIELIIRSLDRPPAEEYWDFIFHKAFLSDEKRENGNLDPFALELPLPLGEYYFKRGDRFHPALLPAHQILIGLGNSGKTTEMQKAADELSRNKCLVVKIPVRHSADFVPDKDFILDAVASPLSLPVLSHYIMDAYWNQFIRSELEKELVQRYKNDLHWMEELRWFYKKFPPLFPTLENEFLTMNWLESPEERHAGWPKTDHEELSWLIRFVTCKTSNAIPQQYQKYERVIILVDHVEQVPAKAIERLLSDFELIVDHGYKNLYIKLFIDRCRECSLETAGHLRANQVKNIEMPRWDEKELQKLLLSRPLICVGMAQSRNIDILNADVADWVKSDLNWTLRLSEFGLNRRLCGYLFNSIVSTALKAYQFQNVGENQDAPYHALRLTRGFISVFAGAYQRFGLDAKTIEHYPTEFIDELCSAYWRCRGGGGYPNE